MILKFHGEIDDSYGHRFLFLGEYPRENPKARMIEFADYEFTADEVSKMWDRCHEDFKAQGFLMKSYSPEGQTRVMI